MIGAGDGRGGRLRRVDSPVERSLPFVALVILLAFGVFFVRLFQLQIIQSETLSELSRGNAVRTERLEAPRGDVLDRFGRTLATTRPAFGVQAIPNDLRRPDVTFAALGLLLDEEAEALRAQVGTPRGRQRFAPVRLAGDLSYDRLARVESHLYALPGVLTDVRPRRHYLGGPLAAHLLGYIGEIQRDQLATRTFADYRQGEVIGQAGVEALLQHQLRGRAGGRNLVVDVAGRLIDVLDEVEPVPGNSVMLTVDRDLQQVAEHAFLPEVLGEPPRRGALVALDPRSGDVLALVSQPAFDPNAFAGGIDARTWNWLTTDAGRPLQNRALSGQYPPGSVYKALVAAAGLQEGALRPSERVFCPGHFRLGRRTYRCWKPGGHGFVDLRKALVQSCDVYFYQLGLKLGIDRLALYARGFNLAQRTGMRLAHEKRGLVPTEAWKERRFGEPWVLGETVSAAIGQGFNLVTPLQVAVAYGAIANGGRLLRPRIVLRLRDQEGAVREGPPPEVLGKVPVNRRHLARIRDALEGVVGDPRGTGGRARLVGVRVAGKTGTAQVVRLQHTEDLEEDEVPLRHRDHAWFVAFAPVEDPEIVVAVLVEHGGHGGSAAAPIAQRVLARYFEKKGVIAPRPERIEARPAVVEGPPEVLAAVEAERVQD